MRLLTLIPAHLKLNFHFPYKCNPTLRKREKGSLDYTLVSLGQTTRTPYSQFSVSASIEFPFAVGAHSRLSHFWIYTTFPPFFLNYFFPFLLYQFYPHWNQKLGTLTSHTLKKKPCLEASHFLPSICLPAFFLRHPLFIIITT